MKVVAIIQARMGSSRLPKKSLMKLANSTLLETVIHSVKKNDFIDDIVVATTNLSIDDVIEEKCKSLYIKCFRGSENDVLSRFIKIAKGLDDNDVIIRVTADNPVNNAKATKRLFDKHIAQKSDYTCVKGLSHIVYEFVNVETLLKLDENNKVNSQDREHVTMYIRRNPSKFKVIEADPKELDLRPDLDKLLTVDTEEDYKRLHSLFQDNRLKHIKAFSDVYDHLAHYDSKKG